MSDTVDRTLGRIEGKLDALEDDIAELKDSVKESRAENQELRAAIAQAAAKFDPETGMLRAQYVACPYHREPPAAEIEAAKAKERTGVARSVGKLVGWLLAAGGAAWAYVAGSE